MVSRDARHLAAIAWPECSTLGQVWHDCIHPRPRISASYELGNQRIMSGGKIYLMVNDGGGLLGAFERDFPDWQRPDLAKEAT